MSVNTSLTFTTEWDVSGSEVDCLAQCIKGAITEISQEEVQSYMQGIFERLVAHNFKYPTTEKVVDTRPKGMRDLTQYTPTARESYLRGWHQYDKVCGKGK